MTELKRPRRMVCRYQMQKKRRVPRDAAPCLECPYCIADERRDVLPPYPGTDESSPASGTVIPPATVTEAEEVAQVLVDAASTGEGTVAELEEALDSEAALEAAAMADADDQEAAEEMPTRPSERDRKADWVAYAVARGYITADDAEGMNKTGVIGTVREHERF
jgi:hypothetical protein